MNGRMKDLAYEAVLLANEVFDYKGKEYSEIVQEKFSELIVKECMEQVWYTREDMINDNISEVIKLRIKEHFGVEE